MSNNNTTLSGYVSFEPTYILKKNFFEFPLYVDEGSNSSKHVTVRVIGPTINYARKFIKWENECTVTGYYTNVLEKDSLGNYVTKEVFNAYYIDDVTKCRF